MEDEHTLGPHKNLVSSELVELTVLIDLSDEAKYITGRLAGGSYGYGVKFKNETFEMHPAYWGEEEEETEKPNFKCKDLEIRWYKYIGRGMTANRGVSHRELIEIFEKCRKSLNWEVILESQRELVLTKSGKETLQMIMSDKEIEDLYQRVKQEK